jgi:hypothetical protein
MLQLQLQSDTLLYKHLIKNNSYMKDFTVAIKDNPYHIFHSINKYKLLFHRLYNRHFRESLLRVRMHLNIDRREHTRHHS